MFLSMKKTTKWNWEAVGGFEWMTEEDKKRWEEVGEDEERKAE